MHFIREWKKNNTYIYREQLKANVLRQKYFLKVDMGDLHSFDDPLVSMFRNNPTDLISRFESAVETIFKNDIYDGPDSELDYS